MSIDRPTTFEWHIGGYPGPDSSVNWDGDALYCTYTQYRDQTNPSDVDERLVPTDEAWSKFWSACERIGVWGWQEQYAPPAQTCDGTHWGLHFVLGSRAVKSAGDNAEPSARRVASPLSAREHRRPCQRDDR